jgi:hypothetical protein
LNDTPDFKKDGPATARRAAPALFATFLGIPTGLPLILVIIGVVLLMWMARQQAQEVLRAIFTQTSRVFASWGFWLRVHGRKAKEATAARIAAHRAEELRDRMLVLEDRIGRRADKLPQELGGLATKLDAGAHSLETSAKALAGLDINLAAERAVRSALPRVEEGRGVHKVHKAVGAVRVEMAEQIKRIRPELGVVQHEAPRLRKTAEKLAEVEARFTGAVDGVNKSFADFEECLRAERVTDKDGKTIKGNYEDAAARQSILVPWLIALLISAIAISGVFLNFFLIERPMSEIVGEGSKIAGVGLPTFAAMIVIFLEFVAGVVLMDAAGLTKLIPVFHTMSDMQRRILFCVAFVFLMSFSVLEAVLALVRDQILLNNAETIRIAEGVDTGSTATSTGKLFGIQLSTFAQVVLAVLIPWMLATAALPLETIVRNTVFIIQLIGAYALLITSFICKTLSNLFKSLGRFVLTVYDLIIFAPLWIERTIKARTGGGDAADRDDAPPPPKQRPTSKPEGSQSEKGREMAKA